MAPDQEMKVRSKWVNRWLGGQYMSSRAQSHTHDAGTVIKSTVY